MINGMQLLLSVLRKQMVTRTVSDDEWIEALLLAEQQEVLPLTLWRLEESSIILSSTVAAKVESKRREAIAAGFVMRVELEGLLSAFAMQGIPILPLKGPFLAERAYGGVSHRPNKDLDLLVSHEQFKLAEKVLKAAGFARGFVHEHNSDWVRGTTKVELHFDVANPTEFDFHLESVLTRSKRASFGAHPALQMTAEDELLYLCLHGARHRFTRLRYCADIAFAARLYQKNLGAEWLIHMEHRKLLTVALLGKYLAEFFEDSDESGSLSLSLSIPGSAGQQRVMREFAEELWAALLQGEATEDTGLNWHRFFVRLEASAILRLVRRVRHLSRSAINLIETDFRFASRYGIRRPWQVRLLRPVRLFLQYFHREL